MTVEEIKKLCNQVTKAANQLNDDYNVLMVKKDEALDDLISEINSKLKSLKEEYSESVKQLCNTVLNTKGGVDLVYKNSNSYPKTIQYEKRLLQLNFGDELVCVLDENGDFYFAIKNYMNSTLVRDLDRNKFLIGTNGKIVSVNKNVPSLKIIVDSDSYNKEFYIKRIKMLLKNMEPLLQKSIAGISESLLKSTIDRNKNITNLISKE